MRRLQGDVAVKTKPDKKPFRNSQAAAPFGNESFLGRKELRHRHRVADFGMVHAHEVDKGIVEQFLLKETVPTQIEEIADG